MAFKRNKFLTNNIMARGLSGYCLSTLAIDQYSRNKLLHFTKLEALPNGTRPPNSFLISQINGAMASRGDISSLSVLSNLAGGRNLEATEAGTLTTNNPTLDRVITLFASTSGNVSVSATMSAALLLQAYSNGQISASVLIGAIFSVTAEANMTASGTPFLSALANIGAEAGGPNPLSPEGLAEALWNAALVDYQATGSFGKALKDALDSVGGGDPESIADAVMNRGVLKLGDFIALK